MARFFYLDESPIFKGKYVIRSDHSLFPFLTPVKGSYNVFIARLLNLKYTDYLRYARDRLGAELIGKNQLYVVPYFDKNETTEMFVKLLNARAKYAKNEYDYPFEYKLNEEGNVTRVSFNNEDIT